MALLLLTLQLAQLASGEPSISFPINSQLPPVARIGELFSYAFSPYTFRSDTNITYSLGDHPDWLSIESGQRRLFGTPADGAVPPGDVVGQSVEVVATDATGTISLNTTLVVSRNEAPVISTPISKQIDNFGLYSAPSSLLSYPSTAFKYSFDRNTFKAQGGNINYYAISEDSSPLPAWMSFDTDSLTFSGTTPSFETLVQPPQTFNFELVASDVVGFSATSIPFSIVVGSHKLTSDKPTVTLKTTRGSRLRYEGLEDGVKLDDRPVKLGDLDVSTDDLPGWLSFDSKTWKIEGTPGPDDHSTNFTINFHDNFADTLSVLGVVIVATKLFKSTFPGVDVMPGDQFELDLSPFLRDPDDVVVKIDANPGNSWLKLDGLKMSGRVPKSAKGDLEVSIEAASKSTALKDTEMLEVSFVSSKPEPTTSTATSRKTTTATTTTTGEPTHTIIKPDTIPAVPGPGELETSQIILATIIPVLFIALVIMLLVCFFRRRRTKRNYLSSRYREKISKPVLGSLRVNGSDPSIRHVENEKMGGALKEAQALRAAKSGYAEVTSRTSSGSRTDIDSLEPLSTPDLPPGFMGGGLGSGGMGSASMGNITESSSGGRQSWFTVEGGSAAHHSDGTRSQRSDTTFSQSTQQLLTAPSLAAFRSGLDLTIPSLDDFSSLQPTPDVAYQPGGGAQTHKSTGLYSTVTSSSEALPAGPSNARVQGPTERGAISPLWEQEESASKVPELRPPTQARLSSQQWLSGQRPRTATGPGTGSQGWHTSSDSQGSKSMQTETSFGSSENWRVIGPQGKSYRDLVAEAPFHPGPGGGGSSMESSGDQALRRDDSGKVSKGSEGSFKAFL